MSDDDHATISDRLNQLHSRDQGRASHVVSGLRRQLRQTADQLAELDADTVDDPADMTVAELEALVEAFRELGADLEIMADEAAVVLDDLRAADSE